MRTVKRSTAFAGHIAAAPCRDLHQPFNVAFGERVVSEANGDPGRADTVTARLIGIALGFPMILKVSVHETSGLRKRQGVSNIVTVMRLIRNCKAWQSLQIGRSE